MIHRCYSRRIPIKWINPDNVLVSIFISSESALGNTLTCTLLKNNDIPLRIMLLMVSLFNRLTIPWNCCIPFYYSAYPSKPVKSVHSNFIVAHTISPGASIMLPPSFSPAITATTSKPSSKLHTLPTWNACCQTVHTFDVTNCFETRNQPATQDMWLVYNSYTLSAWLNRNWHIFPNIIKQAC